MKKLLFTLIVLVPLAGFSQSDFTKDLNGMIKMNSEKVIALAEAIPEDDYSWAPSEGVRDVKGVIIHIIGANYFFPTVAGATMPEGVNPREFGETIKTKAEAIQALKDSYTFLAESMDNVDVSSLNNTKEMYGMNLSIRQYLLLAYGHCEEHMGQLIAYARANEITPPWSMEQ